MKISVLRNAWNYYGIQILTLEERDIPLEEVFSSGIVSWNVTKVSSQVSSPEYPSAEKDLFSISLPFSHKGTVLHPYLRYKDGEEIREVTNALIYIPDEWEKFFSDVEMPPLFLRLEEFMEKIFLDSPLPFYRSFKEIQKMGRVVFHPVLKEMCKKDENPPGILFEDRPFPLKPLSIQGEIFSFPEGAHPVFYTERWERVNGSSIPFSLYLFPVKNSGKKSFVLWNGESLEEVLPPFSTLPAILKENKERQRGEGIFGEGILVSRETIRSNLPFFRFLPTPFLKTAFYLRVPSREEWNERKQARKKRSSSSLPQMFEEVYFVTNTRSAIPVRKNLPVITDPDMAIYLLSHTEEGIYYPSRSRKILVRVEEVIRSEPYFLAFQKFALKGEG